MAQSEPDFTIQLSYTVLPKAVQTAEGTMTLEEKLEVLEADVENFLTRKPPLLPVAEVQSTMTLVNKGSSTINSCASLTTSPVCSKHPRPSR